MRIEKKKEQEMARRKGLTLRTIVQLFWLGLTAVIAYVAVQWLFDTGELTYNFFYTRFFIPRSVPEWAILAGLVLIVVIVMQFFFLLGFAIISPTGRQGTGRATRYSRNPDPLEHDYRR